MIIITGSAVMRPQHMNEALALSVEHSARLRTDPGCIAHNCHVEAEEANRIVFVEQRADMTAGKLHFAVPTSGAFVRVLGAWAVGRPNMEIFEAVEIRAG